jgi:hypothetical protein
MLVPLRAAAFLAVQLVATTFRVGIYKEPVAICQNSLTDPFPFFPCFSSDGAISDNDRLSGAISFAVGFEKVLETGIRA